MASIAARKGDIQFEEFLVSNEDGQKADLLDGVIYMASPDNTEAANLLTWLAILFGGFVEERQLGKIFLSRVAYRLAGISGPEPDLGFLSREHEARRKRGFIDGPPTLAIEIVSPDSVQRDYVQKRATYERSGVKEYWILDQDERRATFLVLRSGSFKKVQPVKNMIRCKTIPGIVLDVSWLISDVRPRAYELLQHLLAEASGSRP